MPVAPIRVEPATSRVDLVFNAGEDVNVELSVVDATGAALAITSAEAMIRSHPDDTIPLHTWTSTGPGANATVGSGSVVLITTRAQTTAWLAAWGDAEWDLEVTTPDGKVKRVAEGQVRVTPSRTH